MPNPKIARLLAGVAAGAFVIALTGAASAREQASGATAAARSVNQAVYSAAQAERGRKVFESKCTTCHDTGRFTGPDFVNAWAGQPLHALYDMMKTTMPEDNPGSLQAQQYADILSFFLHLNKFPAGADELRGSDEAMRAVKMEAPKKAQ